MQATIGTLTATIEELTTKISNEPGTLSMANTGRPDSGGSQFFINTCAPHAVLKQSHCILARAAIHVPRV